MAAKKPTKDWPEEAKATAMGTPESERNIANKISRGGFTAAFFLQCLKASGTRVLNLED